MLFNKIGKPLNGQQPVLLLYVKQTITTMMVMKITMCIYLRRMFLSWTYVN